MKKTREYTIVPALLACLFLAACSERPDDGGVSGGPDIDGVFAFAASQLEGAVAAVDDPAKFPSNTDVNGRWETTGARGWTSGFFPGCLWLMYEQTGGEVWRERAERWTDGLEEIKDYTGNHDVGFMIFSSYGQGYRLTHNTAYKPVIVQAAKSLATRYNPTVGLLMSWNPRGDWTFPVIVDNMMNLELLFWAAKNGGPAELYDIAVSHAAVTMKNHIRPDGSTFHVVDYDPETGGVRGKYTHQGYAEDSCWSRGQAWGVYGFTMTYRETRKPEFLETATRLADYFIDHLPDDDPVPYWDFNAPNIPDEKKDSSAAAIAASALLELETLVDDAARKQRYHKTAVEILTALGSPSYLARGARSQGILLHGVASLPHGNAVDRSLIYGDYYFLEGLLRLKRGIRYVE